MKILVLSQADVSGDEGDAFYFSAGKGRSKRFIVTEHGGQQLQWNIPPRVWNTEPDTNAEAFDQINLYFAQLDEGTQAAIFEKYKHIHDVLRATNMQQDDCEGLVEAIRPLAAQLFSYIDPVRFNQWVWSFLKPRIPADIKTHFDSNTMPGTREKTYLLEDYKDLIPLAIVVRAACPFWFDFATLTNKVLSRNHKDMLAYGLIEQSWPAKCQGMERLELFVDHTIGNDRNNPVSVLMGISSDDYVHWALSGLVINRLPVVDVMGTNAITPVVSAMYNYIRHRVTTVASSQPAIKNKFAETSYSTDENNQSFLEGFRNRIALTVGQEAIGDFYLERQLELIKRGDRDPMSLIERVAPGIDYQLVLDALESTKYLHDKELAEEQVTMAGWLFHPYSQVRTVGNLLKDRVVSLLALAQAVLLHYEKYELAKLVSAYYERVDNTGGTHWIGESINPLRATDRENYRAIFPMERHSRNQKKTHNWVFENVYKLVHTLQEYDINCTFSDETLRKVQGNNPNRKCFLRRESVVVFMEYVKWLAERPMVRINPDEVYNRLVGNSLGIQLSEPYQA